MIELASANKFGLPINSPVMPAAGFFGYHGGTYAPLIRAEQFGALVTNPITLRPQRHSEPPQIAEVSGGVIVNTAPNNPGVKRVIRQNRKFWQRSNCPVIAHLPADEPGDLARTAGTLDGLACLAGFELDIPADFSAAQLQRCVHAVFDRSELPLLVKLPLNSPLALIESAIEAGTDSLVLSANPPAAYCRVKTIRRGTYFGGGIVAQALPKLLELVTQFPDTPLIVGGGIHTHADVFAYLQTGVVAVQIDSLIFIDPAKTQQILSDFYPEDKP